MKNQDLFQLFVDELADMFSSEQQIVKSLPKFISLVSLPDLKDALTKHLKETQNQVKRIEKIFSILGIPVEKVTCEAIEGLIKEAEELTESKTKSAVLDAAIISAAQKIEHYEIASYGTLRQFAKTLDFDREVVNLIQETLDEETAAEKKLTKIADGGFFTVGVNQEAAEATTTSRRGKHTF